MMKWKARTDTINVGILELGNLTFDEDYMEVSIDICGMSDSLKTEVDKAIEIAKVKYTEKKEAINRDYDTNHITTWSDEPVIIDFTYLRVVMESGKPMNYQICVGFHDAIYDCMEQWDCAITVDLSKYSNELKKVIIKVLVDKFF